MPPDAEIVAALRKRHGVVEIVANDLLVDYSALSNHIARNPDLEYIRRSSTTLADAGATLAIRGGCVAGELGWVALRLRQKQVEGEKGAASGGSDQAIDFTREIEDVAEMSDTELRECIKREIMQPPAPGERCACCGMVAQDKPQEIESVAVESTPVMATTPAVEPTTPTAPEPWAEPATAQSLSVWEPIGI